MWMEEVTDKKGNVSYKYCERYKDPLTEKDRKVSVTLTSKSSTAKKQAQQELTKKISDKLQITSEGNITWGQARKEWWNIYKHTVRPGTILNRKTSEKKIREKLGDDVLIKNITSNFLADFLNDCYYKQDYSKCYVNQLHTYLNLVFQHAKSRGYIFANPLADVKIKQKTKTLEEIERDNNKYLEKKELEKFLIYERQHSIRFANTFEFMALMGTRIGETVALKFSNVKENVVEIKSSYSSITKKHGPTKNDFSYRKIEAPDRVLEIIKEQKDINRETCILQGDNYEDRGYIFSDNYGFPFSEGRLNWHLREEATPAMKFPNKKLTTHIFRHTHISILAELGVPLKAVMARVGHNNPSTTLGIYTHVTEGMQAKVIEKLNGYTFAPSLPLLGEKNGGKNEFDNKDNK